MNRQPDPSSPDLLTVVQVLQELYSDSQDVVEIESLAAEILIYVQRARMELASLPDIVKVIAANYLRDGQRVQHLLQNPDSPVWGEVLTQVFNFAAKHSLYPKDTEAISWPDLDAFEDIKRNLRSYNFTGSLDHWITVAIVNRLRRYWRDRKSLSAGGRGFKSKSERESDAAEGDAEPPTLTLLSLDHLLELGVPFELKLDAEPRSVARDVENTELWRCINEAVLRLAERKQDELLPLIWFAVVDRGWRLREVADIFDLTISQVHRRIEQTRAYLRADPDVRQWLPVVD